MKQIPATINRRSSALSFNKEILDEALRSSGFNESLHCCKKNTTSPTKSNRNRNIIWLNPPYSKNVRTNVAKTFHEPNQETLLTKPQSPPLYNKSKNNVKVSYRCLSNMDVIIYNHNKNILINNTTPDSKTDGTVEKKTNAL